MFTPEMINEHDEVVKEKIPKLKKSKKNLKAWNVILDGKIIDTVYYSSDMDSGQVKRTLIAVDGYPREITIEE